MWNNKHKQGAAQAAVNSRELCGDELAAIKQYADDNGLPFPKAQLGSIFYAANKIWNTYRKQAGVKSL